MRDAIYYRPRKMPIYLVIKQKIAFGAAGLSWPPVENNTTLRTSTRFVWETDLKSVWNNMLSVNR